MSEADLILFAPIEDEAEDSTEYANVLWMEDPELVADEEVLKEPEYVEWKPYNILPFNHYVNPYYYNTSTSTGTVGYYTIPTSWATASNTTATTNTWYTYNGNGWTVPTYGSITVTVGVS